VGESPRGGYELIRTGSDKRFRSGALVTGSTSLPLTNAAVVRVGANPPPGG